MKHTTFFALALYLLALPVMALSPALKQKYPYSVLTDDYGILTETDLNSLLDGVFIPTELPSKKHFFLYWQCFPRKDMRINLKDIGYSSYNIDENDTTLTIEAYTPEGTHLYDMRRNAAASANIDVFQRYQKLVRGQQYICLEGTYFFYKDVVTDGKKRRTYYWTFEKIKTKKGCESYFVGRCHEQKKAK
jgi:hypothetical protein